MTSIEINDAYISSVQLNAIMRSSGRDHYSVNFNFAPDYYINRKEKKEISHPAVVTVWKLNTLSAHQGLLILDIINLISLKSHHREKEIALLKFFEAKSDGVFARTIMKILLLEKRESECFVRTQNGL